MSKQNQINEEDLSPLAHHLNEWYGGNISAVCRHLDNILFMLFFLEEEAFSREEVQKAGYALKHLRDSFDQMKIEKPPS